MKQTIFTLVLAIVYLSSFAAIEKPDASEIKTINYVVNEDGVKYYKKMRNGITGKLIAKTFDGKKVIYNLDEVKSYRLNGKEYQSKYVVNQESSIVDKLFLQRIYTTAGYSLFKRVRGANERFKLTDLYVYKGDIQMYQLNKENYKVILSFFFPKFNMMFSK